MNLNEKRLIILAFGIIIIFMSQYAKAEEKLKLPYPTVDNMGKKADRYYCEILLQSSLEAHQDTPRYNEKGLIGTLSDENLDYPVYIFVKGDKLHSMTKDMYDSGVNDESPPLEIIVNNKVEITAIDTYKDHHGSIISVFTMNKKTNIGIWMQTNSTYFEDDVNPNTNSFIMKCTPQ